MAPISFRHLKGLATRTHSINTDGVATLCRHAIDTGHRLFLWFAAAFTATAITTVFAATFASAGSGSLDCYADDLEIAIVHGIGSGDMHRLGAGSQAAGSPPARSRRAEEGITRLIHPGCVDPDQAYTDIVHGCDIDVYDAGYGITVLQ